MTKPAEYIIIIRLPRTSSYLFVLHNKSSLQSRRQLHWNIRLCWVRNMKTQLSVALVFVLCGIGIETVATDCISRREFDDFKAKVLNHIQELTLKNEKQAKQIEYQKKSFSWFEEAVNKIWHDINLCESKWYSSDFKPESTGRTLNVIHKWLDDHKTTRKTRSHAYVFLFLRVFYLLKKCCYY